MKNLAELMWLMIAISPTLCGSLSQDCNRSFLFIQLTDRSRAPGCGLLRRFILTFRKRFSSTAPITSLNMGETAYESDSDSNAALPRRCLVAEVIRDLLRMTARLGEGFICAARPCAVNCCRGSVEAVCAAGAWG